MAKDARFSGLWLLLRRPAVQSFVARSSLLEHAFVERYQREPSAFAPTLSVSHLPARRWSIDVT
jgi:hypothetical protein